MKWKNIERNEYKDTMHLNISISYNLVFVIGQIHALKTSKKIVCLIFWGGESMLNILSSFIQIGWRLS